MAIHPNLVSMLRESVQEYFEVANYCVSYQKEARWGHEQAGGCFGYPAAVMLFSIVDTIGSYHRGDSVMTIQLDGERTSISSDGFQHFYILNSDYYGLSLERRTMKMLYDNFRSPLIHNASLDRKSVV